MPINVGNLDRLARGMIAFALFAWVLSSGPLFGSYIVTIIITIFGLANAFSAIFSRCVVYSIFGLSSVK